jgi:hypothetical protein
MNIPAFGAESSLGPTIGIYRGKAIFRRFGMGDVSLQQFGGSSFLGRFGETMKCCGYSRRLHRFVCTTHIVSRLEQCECQQDFFGHPIIVCRPPVFSRD